MTVLVDHTALDITLTIDDDGIGIFRKVKNALQLEEERHAILELTKGKFSTDPSRHSGEGIFFTSRMFDAFSIHSRGLYFQHDSADDDERFEEILLDFRGVASIGQAFADEIFRVFRLQNPTIKVFGLRATEEVRRMIERAEKCLSTATRGPAKRQLKPGHWGPRRPVVNLRAVCYDARLAASPARRLLTAG